MVATAGLPNGVTRRSRPSPASTLTTDASLQVVAESTIEQFKTVADPFLSTVNVQLAPAPGATVTATWRFESVPLNGAGISTLLSLSATTNAPQATYESFPL